VRVHEAFMDSPGHRANVLDPSFTHGGVGAAAADNQAFLGHVQNTRMYTELFMEARGGAPAPQPPPSNPPPGSGGGGGGGGSGGGGAGAPAPAQPVATPAPTAQRATMDAPRRPTSTTGIDGVSTAITDTRARANFALWRGAGTETGGATASEREPASASSETVSLEIAAVPSSSGGPLDGLVGAILGFLFG